jgi:Mn2+/Fe2+ NRAMP family transporter
MGGHKASFSARVGKKVGRFFKTLGPGLITGASDDDPSGIATYSQMGARLRYRMLWSTLFSCPLMASNRKVMGRFILPRGLRIVGWVATLVMPGIAVALLVALI